MAFRHVIVGGGTGFIGKYLEREILQRGWKCTVISRMPGPGRMSWEELERYGLPQDTTGVINVAGQEVLDPLQRWTKGFKQNVRNSRIETTKALAKAVVDTKAQCFATISGVAYYKPSFEAEYTEESVCEPYDFFSQLCHDWEAAAKLPENCRTRQVVIRSGVVLGDDGGIVGKFQVPFFFFLGSRVGTGKQYMPWIHMTDLVNMFMFALESYKVQGVLNGVSPQVITSKQFTKMFGKIMWRPVLFISFGLLVKTLFGRDRARMLLEGQKVIPARVQALGFEYKYADLEPALRQTLQCTTPN